MNAALPTDSVQSRQISNLLADLLGEKLGGVERLTQLNWRETTAEFFVQMSELYGKDFIAYLEAKQGEFGPYIAVDLVEDGDNGEPISTDWRIYV